MRIKIKFVTIPIMVFNLLLCLVQSVIARNLDLVMLLDAGQAESLYRKEGALITYLQAALSQKVPILTTGVILHNALEGATQFRAGLAKAGSNEQRIDTLFRDYSHYPALVAEVAEYEPLEQLEKEAAETLDAEFKRLQKIAGELYGKYGKSSTEFQKAAAKRDEVRLKKEKVVQENLDANTKRLVVMAQKSELERRLDDQLNTFEGKKGWLLQSLTYLCNFNFDQWSVFKHVQADLYLLIPKEYEAQKVKKFTEIAGAAAVDELEKLAISQREVTLGFNVDHPNIMRPIASMDNLMRQLNADWATAFRQKTGASATFSFLFTHDRINLPALQNMFVRGKSKLFGRWNIFWVGHGLFTQEKFMKEGATKKQGIFGGWIAGVPKQDFFAMLRFFDHDLWMNSLYFMSCYGGGYHLNQIAQAKYQSEQAQQTQALITQDIEHIPYVIISGASTDAATVSPSIKSNIKNILAGKSLIPNFKSYFAQMDILFNQILVTLYKQQATNTTAVNSIFLGFAHQFTSILAHLTNWQATRIENIRDVAGIPLIWYPGATTFQVVPVGNNIQIIEDERVTTGIPIAVEKKSAVLIYPPNISVPLIINVEYRSNSPFFVSMLPGPALHQLHSLNLWTEEQKGIYFFSNKVNVRLNAFLDYSIFNLSSPYAKTWVIKQLNTRNYENSGIVDNPNAPLTLENVVIHKTTRKGWFGEALQGTVIFTMREPTGQISYFKSEWDDKQKNIKKWKKLEAKVATKEYKTILGDRYDDTIGRKKSDQTGAAAA